MFGMLMSVTTKSNLPLRSLLQRSHAVFGLIGIGKAAFLEQVAHDAAHGGEVVNDQETKGIGSHGGPFRSNKL